MSNPIILIIGHGFYLEFLFSQIVLIFPTNLTTSSWLVVGMCVIFDIFDPLPLGISVCMFMISVK